jgi:hypothetical protein
VTRKTPEALGFSVTDRTSVRELLTSCFGVESVSGVANLIPGRMLHAVDDEDIDGAFGGFQLESKLLLHRRKY